MYKKKDSESGRWLRWCFGLSFLRPDEVAEAMVDDLMSIAPQEVYPFSNYLFDTYINIDENDKHALFPQELWAAAEVSTEYTTNACESFHSRWNESFARGHPNLFTFLSIMAEFYEESVITMQSVHKPWKQSFSTKRLARYVHRECQLLLYKENKIERCDFIQKISTYDG